MNRTKSNGSYFIWSALIALCVLLAVFVLFFTSCSKGADGETKPSPSPSPEVVSPSPVVDDETPSPDVSEPVESTTPSTEPVTSSTELGETEDFGQEYIDKFAFLGDSTTNGLRHYELVKSEQVWTPSNGTLTLNRWNIDALYDPSNPTPLSIVETAAAKKPEYLMITLGVNGVSFMDEEYFTSEYTAMVNAIKEASPDTKIILNSIYPIGRNYVYLKEINNEKVDAANGWIRGIAEATGVRFLNSCTVLKGDDGFMVDSYDNGDDIHLNADAFKLVINYIRTHGYK